MSVTGPVMQLYANPNESPYTLAQIQGAPSPYYELNGTASPNYQAALTGLLFSRSNGTDVTIGTGGAGPVSGYPLITEIYY